MELHILGNRLTVKDDNHVSVDISRRKVRELVLVLALESGSVVPNSLLFERLWDPDAGDPARRLKTAVYNARQVLPTDRLRTEDGGYRLHLQEADSLDLIRFQELNDQARAARDAAPWTAVDLYQQALSLWGTPPLGDLPQTVGMEPLRQSLLGGLRDAREELAETLLELREFQQVIEAVTQWLPEDPLNEHARGMLMLAFSGAGRKVEALHTYRELTSLLGPRARPSGWLESVAAQITDNRKDAAWSPRPVWLASASHRLDGTGFDTDTPSIARVYDYFLGGKDNFAVDREFAEELKRRHPYLPQLVRDNRAFLKRAVRHLAGQAGIRQFLDIGTGLPTQENVHEVAQKIAPDSRVVYVDNDPMVLSHARALLTSTPQGRTGYVDADARDVPKIVREATTAGIDFTRPVAVLTLAILHFLPDADAEATTAAIRTALAPGSYLLISHGAPGMRTVAEAYQEAIGAGTVREPEHIRRFFGNFGLHEPGLVPLPYWRPDKPVADSAATEMFLCGLARKPGQNGPNGPA